MHCSKDAILAAEDRPYEDVPTPEWGGPGAVTRVQTITGAGRDSYQVSLMGSNGPDSKANLTNVTARLLVRCLVDVEGNRLFTDEDADLLGQKSSGVLDRLFAVARRLNALSDRDIKELAKNSDSAPSAASTSDSPSVLE